ncbi:hypothetical protein [Rhodococcoides kroppenstedtii]|uniref:hypothetical protein n=1 Tax=Rhodococcoides kroppenstedtii TaxID=293050 RepID=UPI0028EA4C4F|nr:hypothetical protein [Rhodococcus kroppenstedtii]
MSATVSLRTRALFATHAIEALAAKAEGQDTDPEASRLRNYWVHGEGAEVVEWDQPGSIERCEILLADAPIRSAASLCRSYWSDAHGGSKDYWKDEVEPDAG